MIKFKIIYPYIFLEKEGNKIHDLFIYIVHSVDIITKHFLNSILVLLIRMILISNDVLSKQDKG